MDSARKGCSTISKGVSTGAMSVQVLAQTPSEGLAARRTRAG